MLQEFKGLREDFKTFSTSVDARIDKVRESTGLPPSFWFQIISLMVVLVGGGAAVTTFAIQSSVVPVTISTSNNSDDIIKLDVTLQREMRLLDATTTEQIKLMNASQDVRIKMLLSRQKEITIWQSNHDLRVSGLNSMQTERINALERKVFPVMNQDVTKVKLN
jgi:hypothetical protein